jgi:hypothetical protein
VEEIGIVAVVRSILVRREAVDERKEHRVPRYRLRKSSGETFCGKDDGKQCLITKKMFPFP